jgi:hypothetical protein
MQTAEQGLFAITAATKRVNLFFTVLWIRIQCIRNQLVSWIRIQYYELRIRFRIRTKVFFKKFQENSEKVQYFIILLYTAYLTT